MVQYFGAADAYNIANKNFNLYMVIEFMKEGSLKDWLKDRTKEEVSQLKLLLM